MRRLLLVLAMLAGGGCNSGTQMTAERQKMVQEGEQLEVAVDGSTFDTLLAENGDRVVLVDFWAVWCGPCQELAPYVAEIAAEYQDRLTVAKVDIDQAQDLAARFKIESIPTLVIFRNGQEVTRVEGPVGKEGILAVLSPVIH